MSTYVYALKFNTPAHFGAAESGGKLEQIAFNLTSDTVFGAICCELAQNGFESDIKNFAEKFALGKIAISDLMPYASKKGEISLYLPKPVLTVKRGKTKATPLEEVKKQATEFKKQKKTAYISAASFENYLKSLAAGIPFSQQNDFGLAGVTQKVSCREDEPLLYYVGSFSFYRDTGLYMLTSFEDDADAKFMTDCLTMLGLSGIGGKRSSGYGKFDFAIKCDTLEKFPSKGAKVINKMLKNEDAPWQMNLSSLIPCEDEIDELDSSMYKLIKRGGFITPLNGEGDRKKNGVYAIGAGSCFKRRLKGSLCSLGISSDHEIYRLGKAMYVGFKL